MSSPPSPPTVLVVGDSMLDRYWDGDVERISPEAPVPVLRMRREWQRPGGAANVAVNLRALDCPVTLATIVGDDEAGRLLTGMLHEDAVQMQVVRSPACVTTQKIRAVCRHHQLLRVDIEHPVPPEPAQALADLVGDLLPAHRWVLLSDYAKGALRDCAALIRRASARGCRVMVDPKGDDFERYRGAWLLKPNQAEAERVTGMATDEADFDRRMQSLQDSLGLAHLLVTRGEHGMVLYSGHRAPRRVRSQALEVYDVSGAGDTVMAAMAAALAAGDTLDDAVTQANQAAGLVVGKFGTASVSRSEMATGSRPQAWS